MEHKFFQLTPAGTEYFEIKDLNAYVYFVYIDNTGVLYDDKKGDIKYYISDHHQEPANYGKALRGWRYCIDNLPIDSLQILTIPTAVFNFHGYYFENMYIYFYRANSVSYINLMIVFKR